MCKTTRNGVTEYHMNTYTYDPKMYATGADLLAADHRAAEDIAALTHYIFCVNLKTDIRSVNSCEWAEPIFPGSAHINSLPMPQNRRFYGVFALIR